MEYLGQNVNGKSWRDYANCFGVDPDLFFPEGGASTREARECCRGCVVREECLDYALVNGEKFGIWGGLTERERRRVRRQRALGVTAAQAVSRYVISPIPAPQQPRLAVDSFAAGLQVSPELTEVDAGVPFGPYLTDLNGLELE